MHFSAFRFQLLKSLFCVYVRAAIQRPYSFTINGSFGLVHEVSLRSSRKLQQEFPELKKRYWGRHFWAIGFGCWSTGNITDEMVNDYLEHHRRPEDKNGNNFIIE